MENNLVISTIDKPAPRTILIQLILGIRFRQAVIFDEESASDGPSKNRANPYITSVPAAFSRATDGVEEFRIFSVANVSAKTAPATQKLA